VSITNPIMNPEDKAWSDLRSAASSRLRPGFASGVLRSARGPGEGAWAALRQSAAACLHPGFAARVLRAARAAAAGPSYASQLALSAVTAALCLAAVLLLHQRNQRLADERNLAEWRAIVAFAQEIDVPGR